MVKFGEVYDTKIGEAALRARASVNGRLAKPVFPGSSCFRVLVPPQTRRPLDVEFVHEPPTFALWGVSCDRACVGGSLAEFFWIRRRHLRWGLPVVFELIDGAAGVECASVWKSCALLTLRRKLAGNAQSGSRNVSG